MGGQCSVHFSLRTVTFSGNHYASQACVALLVDSWMCTFLRYVVRRDREKRRERLCTPVARELSKDKFWIILDGTNIYL